MRCHTCKHWIHGDHHRCPPAWLVWMESNSDESDARKIYDRDAETAAETWAERDDCESAEYSIVGGSPATVCVRPVAGGPIERFEVSGESVPQYSARAIDGGGNGGNDGNK